MPYRKPGHAILDCDSVGMAYLLSQKNGSQLPSGSSRRVSQQPPSLEVLDPHAQSYLKDSHRPIDRTNLGRAQEPSGMLRCALCAPQLRVGLGATTSKK